MVHPAFRRSDPAPRLLRGARSRRRLSGRHVIAAVAALTLLSPLAALAALAASPAALAAGPTTPARAAQPAGCAVLLDHPANGRHGSDDLDRNFAEVAHRNGMSVAGLDHLLRADSTVWVDPCGHLYYVEPARPRVPRESSSVAPMQLPASQTFLLHSRPGSNRVIYLDFTGDVVSGTQWNADFGHATITAPAYDTDRNPAGFSDSEKADIQDIWSRVAEDYAPFAVDVTTQDPGAAAIDRSGVADTVFGTRAVITSMVGSIAADCMCGGIAYLAVFDETTGHALYQPAWVFEAATGDRKSIADAVSHEVGHNLGLSHDGVTGGAEYYEGHGAWAPIMGFSDLMPVSQWSMGEYDGANNHEDDIAVIASNGAPLRADDYPDASVVPLDGSLIATGVIGSAADADWFSFVGSGATTITVTPARASPNLDVGVELWSSTVKLATASKADPVRVSFDAASGLGATISTTLPGTGTYRLRVYGLGAGTASTGFTPYASIGQYFVSVATTGSTVTATDLALDVTDSPDPVAAGEFVTYTATVVNNGPAAATATFEDTLPAGVVFNSAIPSQGSCSGSGPVTCPLGVILVGETATVAIRMLAYSPGTLVNAATVSTANDLNAANNVISTQTTATPVLDVWLAMQPMDAGVPGDLTVTAVDFDRATVAGYRGTVHFTSTDPAAVLPADYTFTAADAGTHTFPVTLTTANFPSITVTDTVLASISGTEGGIDITPGPLVQLVVKDLPTPRDAGTKGDISVAATDVYGNPRRDYEGTVHLTSTDPSAVLPADYTYVFDDAGVHVFSVTLNTAGMQAVTATDTVATSVTGTQAGISVTQVPASLGVVGPASPRTAGTGGSLTVTARDAGGATIAGYRGTIHFTSTDPRAILPADYAFTASDGGVHAFTVVLRTAGTQSVKATDTAKASVSGTRSGVVVKPAAVQKLRVSGLATPRRKGVAGSLTVRAVDAYGNTVPTYRGRVHITSTDKRATLPGNYTFTSADKGRHAFRIVLRSVGTWTVKVADTKRATVYGKQTGIQVRR
jgi:uncharacterized repeat protein (TIGR01451 family)